jgi:LmbE family N-acetylglucosaminyl deacetylase
VSSLHFVHPAHDVFVPDGVPLERALARTTDLGIGAHPDDLELMCIVPIGECAASPERWFTGVTCADGAGSARGGRFATLSDDDMVGIRRYEQRRAAELGSYSAVLQLGHPSPELRSREGFGHLIDELVTVLEAANPLNVYTHNLTDKHTTHVAVAAATVHAVRRLSLEKRPSRLVGIEAWRDLDWLHDGEKLRLDASPYADLADQLIAVHESQLEGAKRYDVAARGRRQANATLHAIRDRDVSDQVVVAMDLTPLARNEDLDPLEYVRAAIRRFEDDVARTLGLYSSPPSELA